jgi:Uri superfamily endonuclease
MSPTDRFLDATQGTYALLLELEEPGELEVGRLGRIRFDSRFYLYFGSAFGPGGLGARLAHHLKAARRPHWHIDHLRRVAGVRGAWYTGESARLECTWVDAASALRGVSLVPGFGSSDCRCCSHLLAAARLPSLASFRRRLGALRPGCARVRQLRALRPLTGREDQ